MKVPKMSYSELKCLKLKERDRFFIDKVLG